MVPKMIKTQKDYKETPARIDKLMDTPSGTAGSDELELLTALVELYEDRTFPIGLPDPIDAIRFRMEQEGLKQQDLVPYIGSRSRVSEVLHRRRPLSLNMIRKLHSGLGIPAEIFLQEPLRQETFLPPHKPSFKGRESA